MDTQFSEPRFLEKSQAAGPALENHVQNVIKKRVWVLVISDKSTKEALQSSVPYSSAQYSAEMNMG